MLARPSSGLKVNLFDQRIGAWEQRMTVPTFVQVAARHGTASAGSSAPTPMEGMEGAGGAVTGAVASQALSLDLDQPEPGDVEACYAAELGAVQISDWDSTAPGAYNR